MLSKGHASPLYYAMLKAAGAITDDELLTFRTFGSRLEGHPTPRIPPTDVATGSLGQGLPVGVGLALAGKRLDRMPYQVWVLCGDSEMASDERGRREWRPEGCTGWRDLHFTPDLAIPTALKDAEMEQHRTRAPVHAEAMEGQTTLLRPVPGTPPQPCAPPYPPVEPDGLLASPPSALNFLAGIRLLPAPSVLDYGTGSASDENDVIVGSATTNDIVVGVAVIVPAAISLGVAIRTQRAHGFARRAREVADRQE